MGVNLHLLQGQGTWKEHGTDGLKWVRKLDHAEYFKKEKFYSLKGGESLFNLEDLVEEVTKEICLKIGKLGSGL